MKNQDGSVKAVLIPTGDTRGPPMIELTRSEHGIEHPVGYKARGKWEPEPWGGTGTVPKYYFVFHEFMVLAPTTGPNAEWWRKWMPASQWVKLLEEWCKELQQENGFMKPDLNVKNRKNGRKAGWM